MDYEKAYKEALERARKELKQDLHESGFWAIQRIFPELKESEDERTRKEIVEFIRSQIEDGNSAGWDRWIAYLEKQKEQEPIEIKIDNPNIQKFDPDVKVTTSESSASGKELLYVSNKSYDIGYRDGVNSVKPAEWSEEDKVWKFLLRLVKRCPENSTDFLGEVKKADVLAWLKSLRPSWKPSEEQIANATFNDLAEVYERIRTEMLRRHQDIAINIKEGQR